MFPNQSFSLPISEIVFEIDVVFVRVLGARARLFVLRSRINRNIPKLVR